MAAGDRLVEEPLNNKTECDEAEVDLKNVEMELKSGLKAALGNEWVKP